MKYIKVVWHHSFADEPVDFYSELDEERYEVRKIEVYANQRIGYASDGVHHNNTFLGEVPVPLLHEINSDEEFEAIEMTQQEFDCLWLKYVPK